MGHENPDFYAYADDADKGEALADAVSALYTRPAHPKFDWEEWKISIGTRDGASVSREDCSPEEMIELIRRHFTPRSAADVQIPVELPSFRFENMPSSRFAHMHLGWETSGWREIPEPNLDHERYDAIFVSGLGLWFGSAMVAPLHEHCPIPIGATIQALHTQPDLESILLRLCSSPRIKTGGMSNVDIAFRDGGYDWHTPLELSATYNADHHVARDVALSWLDVHDGYRVHYIAGLALDELLARVKAAPKGATIGLAPTTKLVMDHWTPCDPDELKTLPIELRRRGPRKILPEDELLSREQVLAILQTPPEELLSALAAVAAKPDPVWLEAERGALQVIEAAKNVTDEEKVEIDVDTPEHRYFLGEHAPYHFRRLENGGVMLATHPFRTLWPLWSDALRLLGIRR